MNLGVCECGNEILCELGYVAREHLQDRVGNESEAAERALARGALFKR